MAKTNIGLVEYATIQLGKPYWYGTFGNKASAELFSVKKKQYPKLYNRANYNQGWEHQYGLRVHDCVGLIKGYLWSDTPTSTPKYVASQDVSANGMLSVCKEKGNISTIPEIPGILVFMDGHVGVYIGNGEVIEARGHDYGVVKTKLKSRPWIKWGKCPWVTYTTKTEVGEKETVKTEEPKTVVSGINYFPKYTGKSVSVVDALKSVKAEYSFSYRSKIAKKNNITAYVGLPAQNTKMLTLLKQGKLIRP